MAFLFGRKYTRKELLEKVGNIDQLGGTRRVELREGNQKGTSAIDVSTGSGFNYTVLPDRGLDISSAFFEGASLCWRSPTGNVHPAYYEPEGLGWLRSFYGGLVVTCGLTYAGAPCVDEGETLGLHGRVSNIPATNVVHGGFWDDDDDYIIYVGGEVREAALFGPNLVMRRHITSILGCSSLMIHDEVTNDGPRPTPHMMLYHINIGFPVVDDGTELIAPSLQVTPRDEEAAKGAEQYAQFHAPVPGYKEKCYRHEMAADSNGDVLVGLANPNFANGIGLGVFVRYQKKQLPIYTEWKMMGPSEYVVGIEPANCFVTGRDKARAAGELVVLEPGEKRSYTVEIGVLQDKEDIDEFRNDVQKILTGTKSKRKNKS